MCANDPNDEHLNDENMVHMVDKVLHVDKEDHQHNQKVQMHQMMVVVLLDYLHPCQDFVFSI